MAVPAIPEAGKPWLDWAQGVDAEARKVADKADTTDPRLTDARTPTAHTHPAAQVSDSTAVGRSVLTAADAAAARTAIGAGTSNLAIGTTASTAKAGNYTPTKADVGLGSVDNTADTAKPVSTAQQTAIDAAKARANHTGTQAANTITGLATVATSGAYGDLSGKPTIPTTAADIGAQPAGSYATTTALSDGLSTKVNSSTYTAGLATKLDAAGLDAAAAPLVADSASATAVALRAAFGSGVVEYDDAARRYPEQDRAATYLGQFPPPEDRPGLYVYRKPVEPAISYFTGLWRNPLPADAPLEDRPAYNGTGDTTNNRAGTPYATRLANISTYHTTSTPVAGLYARGDNTAMNTGAAPLYIMPTADHPRQRVWIVQNGTVMADNFANGLPPKFLSVPVPVGADGSRFETYYGRSIDAAGGDKQAVFYDPFTDEMWEVFGFGWNATSNRYEAFYGGYIPKAKAAPPAMPNLWGSRATSLPLHPSIMSRVAWEEGVIRHPIGLAIQVVLPGFIPPATRQDGTITWHTVGNDGRDAVPEGAWFRLPASYVVNENKYPASPAKSKMFAMITRAARDYGIVVNDGTGGSMTIGWEADNAVGTPYSPLTTSTLPVQADYNSGPYYGNGSMLAFDFPWSQLVQLKYTPEESA